MRNGVDRGGRWRGFGRAVLVTLLWLLAPAAARACTVCYGAAQDPVLDGTRLSVVFLLALTYLLLGGGIAVVLLARRNLRKHERH